jgi:hypothetical protein
MANVKITDLTAYTDPLNTDVLAIVDVTNNVTKKVSIANMAKNVSLGTAALPGVAFDGDPNTGIYSPGADQLAVATNGTGRLFVDSAGKVGIGTSTPGVDLEVSGDSADLVLTSVTNNNATGANKSLSCGVGGATAFSIAPWQNSGFIDSATTNGLALGSSASTGSVRLCTGTSREERLRITSAGLVGIGDSAPESLLHLKGSNATLKIESSVNTGYSSVEFDRAADDTHFAIYAYDSSHASQANNVQFYGYQNGNIQFITNSNATPRLTITSAGNVGIGTSSPTVNLHVVGASGSGGIQIGNSADSQYHYINFGGDTSSDNAWQIGRSPTGGIGPNNGFYIYDLKNGLTRLSIDASGRVGIGTTSPSRQLDVNSTAIFDSNGNGTTTSPSIAIGSTGVGFSYIGSQQLAFLTNSTERARIDSSGRLLVGTSSARGGFDNNSGVSSNLQVEGAGTAAGGTRTALSIVNNGSADADSAGLYLARSGGTAVGSFTAVTADDALGRITFSGADGTEFVTGASIEAAVDGTPGANDLPSRLVFSTTADGAASPTERLRIKSDGILIKYGDTASARIQPQTDNAGFLGESTKRWEAVYAVNGTIQTSDVREKTDIVDSPLGAEFIRSLRPVAYRWKVGGYTSTYDDKGNETITPNPGVRAHYGFIAQEVKQAIGETDFGGWLQEDLSDPDSQQSLRLHEFISPIVKALQEALDEIDNLKAEVAALKAQ